jgi:hypothetical protein
MILFSRCRTDRHPTDLDFDRISVITCASRCVIAKLRATNRQHRELGAPLAAAFIPDVPLASLGRRGIHHIHTWTR